MVEWEEIDNEDIIEKYGADIYSSPDADEREHVDLDNLALVDDEGLEINIYDQGGHRIPRRAAIVEEDMAYGGMLFNLRTIHELFQKTELLEEDDDQDQPLTPHYLYPMAGLKTVGHFQANGLMTPFLMKLKELNKGLKERYREGDEDDIEADLLTGYGPLVEGIASQGYNMLSHRVRTQGRYHDVQLGQITAAFCGTHATPGANWTKGERFFDQCEDWLPFDRYHEKTKDTLIDTSIRIENVYRVSLRRLPYGAKNGR